MPDGYNAPTVGPGQNTSVPGSQQGGIGEFMGMQSGYSANAPPGSLYAWQGPSVGQAQANQEAALQQQAAQLNMGAGAGYLGQSGMAAQQGGQSALEKNLYNTMMGNGMSAADLQLQQGQQQTMASMLAAAHSGAGGVGQGTSTYNALQAGQQASAQVNEAAGIQRAQESATAAGLLGQTLNQQQAANLQAAAQQQQMAMSQAQLQEQQNQINAATALGYGNQALQTGEAMGQMGIAQGQSMLGAQQINAQTSAANAQANSSGLGGLMSAGAMLGAVALMADADFVEPGNENKNHITLREEPFGLLMINRRTGEVGKITPQPLTEQEKRIAYAPHGAGGLNDPNRIRTVVHDMDVSGRPLQFTPPSGGGGSQPMGQPTPPPASSPPQDNSGGGNSGNQQQYGSAPSGFTPGQGYGGPSSPYAGSAYAPGGFSGAGQGVGSAYGGSRGDNGANYTGYGPAYNPGNGPSQWNGGWSPAQGAYNPMNDQSPIMHQAFYVPGKYSVSAPPIMQFSGQDANGNWLPGQGPQAQAPAGGGASPQMAMPMRAAPTSAAQALGGPIQQLPVNPAAMANFPAAATGRAAGVARPGPLVSPTAAQVTSDPMTKTEVDPSGGNNPELAVLSSTANAPAIGGAAPGAPGAPQGPGQGIQQGIQNAYQLHNMMKSSGGASPTSPQTSTDGGMTTPSVSPTPDASAGAGAGDLGAAGDVAAADMDLTDPGFERPGGRTIADAFLDQLSKSEATYRYKDPQNEPTKMPTGGRYLGVMAQAVEQTPEIGPQLVKTGPKGKYLEMGPSLSAALAGLGRLNERLDAVESAMGYHAISSTHEAKKQGKKARK